MDGEFVGVTAGGDSELIAHQIACSADTGIPLIIIFYVMRIAQNVTITRAMPVTACACVVLLICKCRIISYLNVGHVGW